MKFNSFIKITHDIIFRSFVCIFLLKSNSNITISTNQQKLKFKKMVQCNVHKTSYKSTNFFITTYVNQFIFPFLGNSHMKILENYTFLKKTCSRTNPIGHSSHNHTNIACKKSKLTHTSHLTGLLNTYYSSFVQ